MKIQRLTFLLLIALVMVACETPCQRSFRIDGPDYYATYVYKFPEGKDLSQNVMILTRYQGRDTVVFMQGYRPIPLHKGYYLDGPILAPMGSAPTFYYLTITYDEVDNGTAPSDWMEHWQDYVIPCTNRYNIYCAYEEFYYRGFMACEDYRESGLYNEDITLATPIIEDVHTDTNILNQWIDENKLYMPYMYGGPMQGGANI